MVDSLVLLLCTTVSMAVFFLQLSQPRRSSQWCLCLPQSRERRFSLLVSHASFTRISMCECFIHSIKMENRNAISSFPCISTGAFSEEGNLKVTVTVELPNESLISCVTNYFYHISSHVEFLFHSRVTFPCIFFRMLALRLDIS